MIGVSPNVAQHYLNVQIDHKPVHKKNEVFPLAMPRVIKEEVDRLLLAGFIREVLYLNWLANIVAVPKKNGKW